MIQKNHCAISVTTVFSPSATTSTIGTSPACVPATLVRPARAPSRSELAMITETVGPGTMMMTKQAKAKAVSEAIDMASGSGTKAVHM